MSDDRIFSNLLHVTYVAEEGHAFLDANAWLPEGGNVGAHGENLTITFLSMNRSALSIRLCSSIARHIPDFRGEVLVVDNGSSEEQLGILKEHLNKMPFKWRLVELGANFGVAQGRNSTIKHIVNDWVMFLDNDIYLVKNPIAAIQKELALLGCHFITLALIYKGGEEAHLRGGHIHLSSTEDGVSISAGSTIDASHLEGERDPTLGTFLAGGACVLKRDTFVALGGYDNSMFIGFEDIEFSVRIFQAGYKVGSSACLAFIHDHPVPDTADDRRYEQQRFSKEKLYQSAVHFQNKHGFKVWSPSVTEWLQMRERDLSINNNEQSNETPIEKAQLHIETKPKVGLIIDVSNWAFSRIADQLVRYLSNDFYFDIVCLDKYDAVDDALHQLREYDIVHVFWRDSLRVLMDNRRSLLVHELHGDYDGFLRDCVRDRCITTSVYDHLFLESGEITARSFIFNDLISGYTVSSAFLDRIYRNIDQYPLPDALASDGVDLELFLPLSRERFQNVFERPLVVGWVGNSNWNSETGVDRKGFRSILLPALEHLNNKGFKLEMLFADKAVKHIPYEMMPSYYSKIDILVCASEMEGTPNPVLEAMACGVPIISTNVGIIPEVFGPKQKAFILHERSSEALFQAFQKLLDKPQLLKELSDENLESILPWSWRHRAEAFRGFFKAVLHKRAAEKET